VIRAITLIPRDSPIALYAKQGLIAAPKHLQPLAAQAISRPGVLATVPFVLVARTVSLVVRRLALLVHLAISVQTLRVYQSHAPQVMLHQEEVTTAQFVHWERFRIQIMLFANPALQVSRAVTLDLHPPLVHLGSGPHLEQIPFANHALLDTVVR
jgi:hypothetical protein